MARNQTTAAPLIPLIPPRPSPASLRRAAATRKACDIKSTSENKVFDVVLRVELVAHWSVLCAEAACSF